MLFCLIYNNYKGSSSSGGPLLRGWFPDEKDLRDKIIELTINWLNDEDYPDHKIWNYFK